MAPAGVNMLTRIILILLLCSDADTCTSGLYITRPNTMEALSGSCLHIPCTFTPVPDNIDVTKPVIGIWFKTKCAFSRTAENVISDSGYPSKSYPMNITGNLTKKECTTLFSDLSTVYSDTYCFRMENGGLKATAQCDTVEITVKDSPWSPSIEISGELKEKELVTITCSALTPCPQSPPKLTWDLPQGTPIITDRNTNGTFTTETQKFTLTDSHDGLQIKCSTEYPVTGGHKTSESNITLSVKYAPKNTTASFSPSGLLSAGQLVNLSCSSRAKPPVDSFTWFRISSEGHVNVSEGAFYRFNLTKEGEYYCVAYNILGNQSSSSIFLRINEINPSTAVAAVPWAAVLGGTAGLLILICLAVFVGCLISKRRPQQETQRETIVKADRAAEEEEVDAVHYGEVDFSNLRPKVAPDSEQDSEQPEETVYSQVRMSKAACSTTRPAENLDNIYANVKKK